MYIKESILFCGENQMALRLIHNLDLGLLHSDQHYPVDTVIQLLATLVKQKGKESCAELWLAVCHWLANMNSNTYFGLCFCGIPLRGTVVPVNEVGIFHVMQNSRMWLLGIKTKAVVWHTHSRALSSRRWHCVCASVLHVITHHFSCQ